jgi:hypothetical protein
MKQYAYVLTNGASGSPIRGHHRYLREPRGDDRVLMDFLNEDFVPLREVVLPNGSAWFIMVRDEPSLMATRKKKPAKSSR